MAAPNLRAGQGALQVGTKVFIQISGQVGGWERLITGIIDDNEFTAASVNDNYVHTASTIEDVRVAGHEVGFPPQSEHWGPQNALAP